MFVNYNLTKNIKNITFGVRALLAKDFAGLCTVYCTGNCLLGSERCQVVLILPENKPMCYKSE